MKEQPTAVWLRRFHLDQEGLFALSHLPTSIFLCIAVLCVFNTGASLSDRNQQQRKTDAVAQSLGEWKARYLNAVVAHQHLMGELMSLVVVHHGIGGDLLDEQSPADTSNSDRRLAEAYQAAMALGASTPAYSDVSSEVLAGEALLASHLKLRKILRYIYYTKAAAKIMQMYPPTAAAGRALERLADLFERVVHLEWRVLESIRHVTLALTPLKLDVLHRQLPEAKAQLDRMIARYPTSQRHLANQLSERFGVEVHILPSDTRLPLKEDPLARLHQLRSRRVGNACECPTGRAENPRHQIAKVTQLSRATFPWMNYHRTPLFDRMRPFTPLSEMADHYFDHVNGVGKRMFDELQRNGDLALYVLDDYEGPDKGFEPWMEEQGSSDADKTFGITVVTGVPTRSPAGSFFFKPHTGRYTYRYASSFIRNSHPAIQPLCRIDLGCKRIVPSIQAHTGWDTLNWSSDITVSEFVGISVPHVFPHVDPAWESSLTATSAARIQQLKQQGRPSWMSDFLEDVPSGIPENLIAL